MSTGNPRSCPICGKSICKKETREGSFRGMLAMHIKHKHEDHWRGDLTLTLEKLDMDDPANRYYKEAEVDE